MKFQERGPTRRIKSGEQQPRISNHLTVGREASPPTLGLIIWVQVDGHNWITNHLIKAYKGAGPPAVFQELAEEDQAWASTCPNLNNWRPTNHQNWTTSLKWNTQGPIQVTRIVQIWYQQTLQTWVTIRDWPWNN